MSQEQDLTPDKQSGENGTAVTDAGSLQDGRLAAGEDANTLTTRQGHPVYDNQNSRTVGNRGPATLENYQLLEKNQPLRPRADSGAGLCPGLRKSFRTK